MPNTHAIRFREERYASDTITYEDATDEMVEQFRKFDLIHLHDVENLGYGSTRTVWDVDAEMSQGHERMTVNDLRILAEVVLPVIDEPLPERLPDVVALDIINYALSAPEWSVSYLEDICEFVRRTGRREIRGAQWPSH